MGGYAVDVPSVNWHDVEGCDPIYDRKTEATLTLYNISGLKMETVKASYWTSPIYMRHGRILNVSTVS
jgi:hypothetical protein